MTGPNANLDNGSELATIPVGNDVPWYFFTIGLSGVQYVMHFRYNVRMQRWIMDINDANGNSILASIPLLIRRDLTGRFKGLPTVPIGTFFATDNLGQESQPTRYSFGVDHTLYYVDPLAVT